MNINQFPINSLSSSNFSLFSVSLFFLRLKTGLLVYLDSPGGSIFYFYFQFYWLGWSSFRGSVEEGRYEDDAQSFDLRSRSRLNLFGFICYYFYFYSFAGGFQGWFQIFCFYSGFFVYGGGFYLGFVYVYCSVAN